MSIKNKTTKLVIKLIRMTSDGKLEWSTKDAPRSITRGTDDVVPLYFEAHYKNMTVAIYKQRYQSFYVETESFYWSEKIVFAVLDSAERVLWESADHSPALVDLLDIVREKSADIDSLLDDLLGDGDN